MRTGSPLPLGEGHCVPHEGTPSEPPGHSQGEYRSAPRGGLPVSREVAVPAPLAPAWSAARSQPRTAGALAGLPGFGWWRTRWARARTQRWVDECLACGPTLAALDEAGLQLGLRQVRASFHATHMHADRPGADRFLPSAVAHLAEVAQRTLQVRAGAAELGAVFAMAQQHAVVLRPPRALAIAMAAVLASWIGQPCHVVLGSDRRVEHDLQELRAFYQFCGVSVGCALAATEGAELVACYLSDVVYCTARKLLADHCRDRRLFHGGLSSLRQRLLRWTGAGAGTGAGSTTRGLYSAIVDDLDRTLIDEASAPLVITEVAENALLNEAIAVAHSVIREFEPGRDYRLDSSGVLDFTDIGYATLDEVEVYFPPMWRRQQRRDDLVMQALLVRDLLRRDEHYELNSGQVSFIEHRATQAIRNKALFFGLTQAIEAHEGLAFSGVPGTVERASFQGLFASCHRLGGAATSLAGVKRELLLSYGLPSLGQDGPAVGPGQVPMRRYLRDAMQRTVELRALLRQWQDLGEPALVCVRRAEEVEPLLRQLLEAGLDSGAFDPRRPAPQDRSGSPGAGLFGQARPILVMPEPWLVALPLQHCAVGLPRFHLLLLEPLGTGRAEADLLARLEQPTMARPVLCFVSFDDAQLAQHLPALAQRLARWTGGGRAQPLVLRWLHRWARMRAWSTGRTQRRLLTERERSLQQQLSFVADPGAASTVGSNVSRP